MTDYAAKISALEDAMASGELTVESDGERVTYRSVTELLKARDVFVALQASQSGSGSQRPASTLVCYDPDC
ncbi:phage head-tail joining protein [Sphingomonas sp. YL-JM2C]